MAAAPTFIVVRVVLLFLACRATSPQPDPSKQKRTRIARTTEGVEAAAHRRSRPPRLADAACQTITVPEYETIQEMKRKVKPSPSFDYFARLKKSMESAPIHAQRVSNAAEEEEEEEEDGYKFEKAAMMQLLPGKEDYSFSSRVSILPIYIYIYIYICRVNQADT